MYQNGVEVNSRMVIDAYRKERIPQARYNLSIMLQGNLELFEDREELRIQLFGYYMVGGLKMVKAKLMEIHLEGVYGSMVYEEPFRQICDDYINSVANLVDRSFNRFIRNQEKIIIQQREDTKDYEKTLQEKDREIAKLNSQLKAFENSDHGKMIQEKNDEINKLKDQLLRSRADFDNFRKRCIKQEQMREANNEKNV